MYSLKLIAFARGCELAEGLLKGAEGCLLHLRAISRVIGKEIRVWDSGGEILGVFGQSYGNTRREIGEAFTDDDSKYLATNSKCGEKMESLVLKRSSVYRDLVELQYLDSNEGLVGHWQTKDGGDFASVGNNCLFDAVCQQCRDFKPMKLRELTASVLRRWEMVAEEVFPQFVGVGRLLVGGAKYDRRDHANAENVLDASQATVGYGHFAKAHPRGHASHPPATGNLDSVENYSRSAKRSFPKSAWMSRSDQDRDMHHLLLLPEVQSRMDDLNRGETRVVVKVNVKELSIDITMGHWAEGVMFRGPVRADFVTILLQHHCGQQNESNADVQVFTCYPMESDKSRAEVPAPCSLSCGPVNSPDRNEIEEGEKRYLCHVQ